ncbi:MAG: Rrf2 family transcriptional regulator [Treponema sp.]|nr:Rrf2 family transcriptional regulator [Treponema sp.]
MRITTKGRYALRATIALAQMGKDNEMISINSLSEVENISSIFLEQIFFKLKKAGIVNSSRGPGGGFSFARPLETLTVKEILDAAGEELDLTLCDRQEEECDRTSYCISHKVFTEVTRHVNNYLDNITMKMLLEDEDFKTEAKRPEQPPESLNMASKHP